MPRELGILYKPYMHLAIREDRKTQTRRIIRQGRSQSWLTAEALGKVVRMEPSTDGWWKMAVSDGHIGSVRSPYRVGDLLYVKEAVCVYTYKVWSPTGYFEEPRVLYRSDGALLVNHHKWRSPLHMPKWAARTWLEVTGVRAERLQDISEADAIAEGVFGPPTSQAGWREYPYESCHLDTAKSSYRTLWESINGSGSWAANPWVWVYEFKRIQR